jgi:hypothetical protein
VDLGSMYISMVNVSMASVMNQMPNSLADGFQLEVRPVYTSTSTLYLVNIVTPKNPRWLPICAGETPTLALMEASRIVGAMDRIP